MHDTTSAGSASGSASHEHDTRSAGHHHRWHDKVFALIGTAAITVAAGSWMAADNGSANPSSAGSARSGGWRSMLGSEALIGGYSGVSYTHPSTVDINNPGRTDLKVKDFGWEGKPFKSPIYYGLRAISWRPGSRFGGMVDFTHAKAIARFEDVASFAGMLNGSAVPPKATIRDVFRHLEFSHGHNMVTLNGLARLGTLIPRVRPYAGIGGGISLPHTEIGFAQQNGRTYEYQFAGLTGQALAGLQIDLGRGSIFLEYKLSWSPYEVPLSGVVNGHLLITDVWRQFRSWMRREAPPDGRLATTLLTHHGIAGALVRVSGPQHP